VGGVRSGWARSASLAPARLPTSLLASGCGGADQSVPHGPCSLRPDRHPWHAGLNAGHGSEQSAVAPHVGQVSLHFCSAIRVPQRGHSRSTGGRQSQVLGAAVSVMAGRSSASIVASAPASRSRLNGKLRAQAMAMALGVRSRIWTTRKHARPRRISRRRSAGCGSCGSRRRWESDSSRAPGLAGPVARNS
jgi:hypothetical protein